MTVGAAVFKKGFPHILYIYVHHQAVQKYSLARLFVSREILYICIELLTYTFHLLFLKFLYVGKPCKRFARLFCVSREIFTQKFCFT